MTSVPFLSFVRNHAYRRGARGNAIASSRPSPSRPATPKSLDSPSISRSRHCSCASWNWMDLATRPGRHSDRRCSGRRLFQPRRARRARARRFSRRRRRPHSASSISTSRSRRATSSTRRCDEADDQDAARTPPANTRVTMSPTTGESFEATYGINPAFYVRILWTLALLPFVAAGFARLAGESGAPLLAAIVERVPQVTIVSDWAAAVSARVRAARAPLLRPADVDDDADSARGDDQPRGHEDSKAHLADPAHDFRWTGSLA